MKKSSRIMSALLAAAMLVVSAAGCSNSGTETSSASSDTATSSSAAEGESSAAESGASDAAPLSGKITVEVFDRGNTGGSDPTNNHWTQWIQEKFTGETGVEVEFVSVPRSEEVPRLNVLMASNSAPDISYTYTASVVYNFYKNGGLADLTSSLANYGQDLTEYLGEEVLSYGQFEPGVQVAIPAKRISLAKTMTYVRKDWLDKLGMELPTTKEEFHAMLTAFKEQDPGNVGTIIRTAYSFGFDAVVLSSNSVDLYGDKLIRSTQGALFHIPVFQNDLITVIAQLKKQNIPVYGTALRGGKGLSAFMPVKAVALVFGNEGNGVSEAVLNACDQNIFIEMESFESLNVAVAAGICMYHMRGNVHAS